MSRTSGDPERSGEAAVAAGRRLSDERTRFALEAAGLGVWSWEIASGAVVWSARQEVLHGLAPGAFGGTYEAYLALVHADDRERVLATVAESLAAGTDHRVEYRARWPDGSLCWLVGWGRVLRDETGEPTGIVGVAMDVSERRRTEEELDRSRLQLAVVFEGVADGITVQAPNGALLFANDAAAGIVGYPSARALLAAPVAEVMRRFEVMDEAGRTLSLGDLPGRRALAGEQPPETLLRFRVVATGEERWAILRAKPVLDERGAVQVAVNVFRDVTEQRRAEQALRDSEASYRLLFEGNPHPMWVFDLETLRFLAVNDAAVHRYGYDREEFRRLTLLDVRPPEDVPALLDKLSRVTSDPGGLDQAGVWRHQDKNGTVFDAEVTTHALVFDGRPARLSLTMDVTERRRAEAALRESEERYRSLVAATAVVVWTADAAGAFVAPQPSWTAYTGQGWPEHGGRGWLGMIHPDDREGVAARWARAVAEQAPFRADARLWHAPSRRYRHLVVRAVPLARPDGSVREWIGTITDVDGRRRAEEALRDSEERFRQLAENVNAVFWVIELPDRRVVYVSPAYERLWGMDRRRLLEGREVWPQFTHPEDRPRVEAAFRRDATVGRFDEEYRIVLADGSVRWVRDRGFPVRDGAGEVYRIAGIAEDVTARRQDEDARRFLAEASTALASSLDYEATLAAVARLAVPRLADWCAVDVLQDDGSLRRLAVTHVDPAKEALAWELHRRYPTDQDAPRGPYNVLRTGRPALVPEIPDELLTASARDAEHLAILREAGLRSFLSVPLVARGRPLGVLTFVAAESGHRYGTDDLTLAEEVARRAAIAVDNARLYADEQAARRAAERATARIARLQAVTETLAETLTPAQVAAVVVGQGIAALGAEAGSIAMVTEDGGALEIVRAVGYPPGLVEPWRRFPLATPAAFTDAVRSGEPVLLGSREAFATRYPHLAGLPDGTGNQAFAAVPLLVDGRAVGSLGLSFREPQTFDDGVVAFMLALTRQSAQALERARLYEAERRARAQAEVAERLARREADRIDALAKSSRVFAEAGLDFQAALDAVARITSELFGDCCVVRLLSEDGEWADVAAIDHPDPKRLAAFRALDDSYRQRADAGLLAGVLRDGRPLLLPVVSQDRLRATYPSEALRHLDRAAIRSLLVVPLRARQRVIGTLSLLRGVPDRPYAEEDQVFLQDLGDRAALAIDNARLYREATEAVRARDEFLSIAAHELRTPVTSVKGFAQLLLRAQARHGVDPERTAQFLHAINDSTDRLSALTNDLLDVSRIRLGQLPLRPRPIDLAAVAGTVVDRYRVQLDERHPLSVEVRGAPPAVVADPDRTEQILTNLLDNAAKYSPTGGPIRVTVTAADDGVLLAVADDGMGLPADETESIFEPFNRATNATRDHLPGLGLGLYICRNIAERHGGRIWAESTGEGRGTTMSLWLPTAGPAGGTDDG